jgi:hypothetical protein
MKVDTENGDTVDSEADAHLLLVQAKGPTVFSRTSFPITDRISHFPAAESASVRPGETFIWHLSGPPGSRFRTTLSFMGGGGHAHGNGSISQYAVGTISPAEGVLTGEYPQNFPQKYTAGQTCGQVLDRTVIGDEPRDIIVTVALGPFETLTASTGISLVGATARHPSNHWGTARLCSALRTLGFDFYTEYSKPIFVNDMSLVTGGRFDINAQFAPPHETHRDGRHADVNRSSMTDIEQAWFRTRAVQLGFLIEEHGDPSHWHLQIT